jgi:hypothetical protein
VKALRVLLVCLFSALCMWGQSVRPYVSPSVSLMPSGYASFAWRVQGGLYTTTKYFTSDVYAAYDNGTKANDNTPHNDRGHDRYLAGFAAYQHNTWFYAAGARWSQLSTTNYSKGVGLFQDIRQGDWRLQGGIGHDSLGEFSCREQVLYVLPPFHESVFYPGGTICAGCGNGVQGPELTLIFPSPADKSERGKGLPGWKSHHLFARFAVGVYEFHDTVTDPTNTSLTSEQRGNRHAMATSDLGVMWRF